MNKLLLIATLVVTTFAEPPEKSNDKNGNNGQTTGSESGKSHSGNSAEKCRCLYGTPWPDCDSMQPKEVNICQTCTPGFVRKSDGSKCEKSRESESETQFKCACENGKAGADCGSTNPNKCESCYVGFQLNTDGTTCLPKRECMCPNGIPAVGKQCTASRQVKCKSCRCPFKLSPENENGAARCEYDPQLYQSTNGCGQEPANCICENGTPGDGCTRNSRKKCQSCRSNFTLNNKHDCEPTKPVCTCANGTPHADKCDGQTNTNFCQRCFTGYQLSTTGECTRIPEKCVCPNGVAGKDCTAGNIHKCKSCISPATPKTSQSSTEFSCELPPKPETYECVCENGIPNTKKCAAPKTPDCGECFNDYELNTEKKTCDQKEYDCSCSNQDGKVVGEPGSTCQKQNEQKCKSCKNGYELTDKNKCRKIVTFTCECSRGTPGTGCVRNGQQKCSKCFGDWVLQRGTCIKNTPCTCSNGRPAKTGCSGTNSPSKCDTCNPGFTKSEDGAQCVSDCQCNNGEASRNGCETRVTSAGIPESLFSCSSCDDGYKLDGTLCVPRCDWADHTETSCGGVRCQWNSDTNACGEKLLPCLCPHGTAFTINKANACPNTRLTWDKRKCATCDAGYTLNADKTRCEKDQPCVCKNGKPPQTKCSGSYASSRMKCASCDGGYELYNSSRYQYCRKTRACTCTNGELDDRGCTGSINTHKCKSCDSGFELNKFFQCEKKTTTTTCQCTNGVPKPSCPIDNREHCSTCNAGFKMTTGGICESACTCRGGSPSSDGCEAENTENCVKCTAGFTLKENGKMGVCTEDKKQCKCDHGDADLNGCEADSIYKCSDCDDDYTLNTKDNTCKRGCITTKNIRRVCCNGKNYMNPSAAACDQCSDYQEGACQQQCGWGEHDSESCRASKCEWTQATANSQPYCTDKVFLPPPAVDQLKKCQNDLCDTFAQDYDYVKYNVALRACKANTKEIEIQMLRRRCAVKKSGTTSEKYKNMMGYGTDSGEKEETDVDKVEASRDQMQEATKAMATSCHTCMRADGAVAEDCKTAAIKIFKLTFANDFDSLANKPSDIYIKTMVQRAGYEFASKRRHENCLSTMSALERRKCAAEFPANAAAASCRAPIVDATEKETEKKEQTKTIVSEHTSTNCMGTSNEERRKCYEERRDIYKEESGKDEASDAEVKSKLEDIASKKATEVMHICVKRNMNMNDAAELNEARKQCLEQYRSEYMKYSQVDRAALDDTVVNAKLADEATKRAGEILKNGGTMEDARKEKSRTYGEKVENTPDTVKDADLKGVLDDIARVEAAKKYDQCTRTAATALVCKEKFKAEYAKRTPFEHKKSGVDEDMIKEMIKEGAAKRKKEEVYKALKILNEEKKSCTEAADVCFLKQRESKRKEVTRITGKEATAADVFREEQKIIAVEGQKIRKQCILRKTSASECQKAIKDMQKSVTGREGTEEEAKREQEEADDRILAMTAKNLDGTEVEQKTARLKKLKEIKDDDTLTEEDLDRADKRIAKKEIEDYLEDVVSEDDEDDAADFVTKKNKRDEAIKKKIQNLRGGKAVTDEEVKDVRRQAETSNSAKELLAAMRAGASEDEKKTRFLQSLKKQGASSKADTTKPIEFNSDSGRIEYIRRKNEAQDDLIQDVIAIDIDTSDEKKRKEGIVQQTKDTQEKMKAAFGGMPKEWEARKEIEKAANKKLLNLQKQKSIKHAKCLQNAVSEPEKAKCESDRHADYEKLRDTYKKATGNTKVDTYEIKDKIKAAAVESPDVRQVMENADTEIQKKQALKDKIEEETGEELDDIEVTKLVKRTCGTQMMNTAKDRARAFDRSKATPEQKRIEMTKRRNAMQKNYEKITGKTVTSHAQVKQAVNDAITEEVGSLYRECAKDKKMSKKQCLQETREKISVIDEEKEMDEIDVSMKVEDGEKLAAVDRAKECQKDSTKSNYECRAATVKFMQEGRGDTKDIPVYQAVKTLAEGASKGLGRNIANCRTSDDSAACKSRVKEDYKNKTLNGDVSDEEFDTIVREAAATEALDMVENCDPEDGEDDCTQVLLDTYKETSGKNRIKKAQAVAAVKSGLSKSLVAMSIKCRESDKNEKECHEIIKKKMRKSKKWKKKKPPKHNCRTKEVWSEEKSKWCCQHKRLGCKPTTGGVKPLPDNDLFNCHTREVWSEEKSTWCCAHKSLGCKQTEEEKAEEKAKDIAETVEVEREQKRGAVQYAKKTFMACHILAKELEDGSTEKALKTKVCNTAFEEDYERADPTAATSRPVMIHAKKQAQINVAKSKLDAMADGMKEDWTKEEIIASVDDAIDNNAPPVEDSKRLSKRMAQEEILHKAGLETVKDAARACKDLGPEECTITFAPVGSRRTDDQAMDDTKISLADEMFTGCGKKLMGQKPTKQDEEEVIRKASKDEIFNGIRDCMNVLLKASTKKAPTKEEMKLCLKDAEDTAVLMHGDEQHKEIDLKDAFEKDGISEMDSCMNAAGHTTWFCRSVMKERIQRTCGTRPTEDAVKHALIKKAASEMDRKELVYNSKKIEAGDADQSRTLDRKREKEARNELKSHLERRGMEKRQVDLALQKSAEMKALNKGADAIKAGKPDDAVKQILEEEFKKNPDSPDLTSEKKDKMIKNCKALAVGGVKGNLKFRKTGKLALSVCHEKQDDTSNEPVTKELIVGLIKSNVKASAVIKTEDEKIITSKTPVEDKLTKRTCGTILVEPKTGVSMKEAKDELDQVIKVAVRRALRQTIGRKLNDDEYSTSSGEEEEIVSGDTADLKDDNDANDDNDDNDANDANDDKKPTDANDDKKPADSNKDGQDDKDTASPDSDKGTASPNSDKGRDTVGIGALAGAAVGCLIVGLIAGALVVVHMKSSKTDEHRVLNESEVEMPDSRIFDRRGSKNSNNPLAETIDMEDNPMRKNI